MHVHITHTKNADTYLTCMCGKEQHKEHRTTQLQDCRTAGIHRTQHASREMETAKEIKQLNARQRLSNAEFQNVMYRRGLNEDHMQRSKSGRRVLDIYERWSQRQSIAILAGAMAHGMGTTGHETSRRETPRGTRCTGRHCSTNCTRTIWREAARV